METLANFKGFALIITEIAKIFLKNLSKRYFCRETVATLAFQWLQPSDRCAAPEHENFEKSSLRREITAKMAP